MNLDLLETAKVASDTIVVSEATTTKDAYYSEQRISNSMLDYVLPLIQGKRIQKKTSPAFAFGSLLHLALLEPHKFSYEQAGNDAMQLYRCVQNIQDNPFFSELIATSLKEVVHFWESGNLPCKAKIDMVSAKYGLLADVKTTNASNAREFSASVEKYNYDRQLAFYCDAIGIDNAIIVAISKKTCQPFLYDFSKSQLQAGREKYQEALYLIHEHNLFEKLMTI